MRDRLWSRDFILILAVNFLLFSNDIMFFNTFAMFTKQELGMDESAAGAAAVAFSLVAVLLRPFVGRMLDTGKRKTALMIGLAGMFLMPMGYLCSGLLTGVGYVAMRAIILAFICRIIHGASHSFANTAIATKASDLLPRSRFAEGMGYFGMATALATSIAPALSLWLKSKSFNILFMTASGFIVVAFILTIFMHPTTPRERDGENYEAGKFSLKTLIEPSAIPASVICLVFLLMYGALQNYLSLYAEEYNLPSGGTFFLITAIMLVLSRIFLGRVADRKGEAVFVYSCNACMLAAFMLLAFVPGQVTFYLSAVLVGYAYGGIEPVLQSMAVHTAKPNRRGAANSTFLCSYDIGLGSGAGIAGFLISRVGYQYMFVILSMAAVCSVLVYVFWGRNHSSSFTAASGR